MCWLRHVDELSVLVPCGILSCCRQLLQHIQMIGRNVMVNNVASVESESLHARSRDVSAGRRDPAPLTVMGCMQAKSDGHLLIFHDHILSHERKIWKMERTHA